MASIIEPGFGGNSDNLIGEAAGVSLKQLGFGEFRARSILAGNAGAIISSVHVTPRDGLTTNGKFPVAGMFDLLGFVTANQLDIVQNNIQFWQTDLGKLVERVFLNSPRSTLQSSDITPSEPWYIPPNKYAHILALTPRDVAGAGISTYFHLTVTGRQLDGSSIPATFR